MTTLCMPRPQTPFCPEQPWFVLSAAKEYLLMMSDNPLISHFYNFTVEMPNSRVMAIPDGCIDILFDCDAVKPTARICGSPLQARTFDLIDNHQYFGVRFAPGIVPFLSTISAEELAGQEFDMDDVFPGSNSILDNILAGEGFKEKVAAFNQAFSVYFETASSSLTRNLLNLIRHHNGNLQISELEALTGYTSRTMLRQFRHDTGLSPKAFSRIIRCHSALNHLHFTREQSFLDLALELGFSDQPHFQREFKSMVTLTPLEYQQQIQPQICAQRMRYS